MLIYAKVFSEQEDGLFIQKTGTQQRLTNLYFLIYTSYLHIIGLNNQASRVRHYAKIFMPLHYPSIRQRVQQPTIQRANLKFLFLNQNKLTPKLFSFDFQLLFSSFTKVSIGLIMRTKILQRFLIQQNQLDSYHINVDIAYQCSQDDLYLSSSQSIQQNFFIHFQDSDHYSLFQKVPPCIPLLQIIYYLQMSNQNGQIIIIPQIDRGNSDVTQTCYTRLVKWIKENLIILENSRMKIIIEIIEIIIVLYNSFITPLALAFTFNKNVQNSFDIVDTFTDSLFGLLILFKFLTAYTNQDGQIITDHSLIALNYIKGWFFFDIFSVIPFQMLASFDLSLIRALRLIKQQRLFKLFYCRSIFSKIDVKTDSILRNIFMCIIYLHLLTCGWLFIGKLEMNSGWIYYYGFDKMNYAELYCQSLYFIIETVSTIGFGDITARNDQEMICVIFLMQIGAVGYSMVIGTIMGRIQTQTQKKMEDEQRKNYFDKICENLKFCDQTKDVIYTNLKKIREKQKSQHINTFLAKLPIRYRSELAYYINSKVIQQVKFLRDRKKQNYHFIGQISANLDEVVILQNQKIILKQQIVNQMYFIAEGTLALFLEDPQQGNKQVELGDWDSFGQLQMLFYKERIHEYKAKTDLKLYRLSHENFKRIFTYFFVNEYAKLKQSTIHKKLFIQTQLKEFYSNCGGQQNLYELQQKKILEFKTKKFYKKMKIIQGQFQAALADFHQKII